MAPVAHGAAATAAAGTGVYGAGVGTAEGACVRACCQSARLHVQTSMHSRSLCCIADGLGSQPFSFLGLMCKRSFSCCFFYCTYLLHQEHVYYFDRVVTEARAPLRYRANH